MSATRKKLIDRYERATPRWRDKMRALGYYSGYLDFLSEPGQPSKSRVRVLDVGAGTGAFAEAWVAINGAPEELTLLDPSPAMLSRAEAILMRRGVRPHQIVGLLGDQVPQADEVLAAHIIEHCPDPLNALRHLRALIAPGGRLYLVVSKPHWCNAIIWFQWRHRTFSQNDMLRLFDQAQLRLVSSFLFPFGPPSRTSHGFVVTAI